MERSPLLLNRNFSRAVVALSQTQKQDIRGQLDSGARFLDLRIAGAENSSELWLVHGVVAAVLLRPALEGVADWQRTFLKRGWRPPAIVIVVRATAPEIVNDVTALFQAVLGAPDLGIYDGDAAGLRALPYVDLPPTVLSGVPGIGSLPSGEEWGADEFVDTFSKRVKRKALVGQVQNAAPRESRDDLFVLPWTLTPQRQDFEQLTLGIGNGLEFTAGKFNREFARFAGDQQARLENTTNVVFFDFFTPDLAAQVERIRCNTPTLVRVTGNYWP